ncbi:MAG: DUF1611 domain-containing protein [Candidatus Aminicenantes bacterium]|jgi:uncharacterized NAD-dependent epimerase/dehydratase family protein
MTGFPEGNAIVFCEGAFGTPNGKTAHGLVRRTNRYRVLSVIDSKHANKDSGEILDGRPNGISIFSDLSTAMENSQKTGPNPTHFVVGLAPDGGRLSPEHRSSVVEAIRSGLNIDSGLHDFLSEDEEMIRLSQEYSVVIRDVRKPPPMSALHFFSGKIEQVDCLKVAVLGTDSAVGKRTTAWILTEALNGAGYPTELIGTGQTAWMQGVNYGIIMDSLINDFVSGEIEHAVWSAWNNRRPELILIEGQGSLMNPAYPGGFEILAAGRPDVVILQHAPARKDYDGFPGYPIQPLDIQIKAVELLSGKKVVAITINHEDLSKDVIPSICRKIEQQTGRPTVDVLLEGADKIIHPLLSIQGAKSAKNKDKVKR